MGEIPSEGGQGGCFARVAPGCLVELIVGNKRVVPQNLRAFPGGVEVQLAGEGLTALLDAAFRGAGSIEALGGDLDRRRLEVTDIRMSGATTNVVLMPQAGIARLH